MGMRVEDEVSEAAEAAAERVRHARETAHRDGEYAALDWATGIVESLGSGLLLFGLSVLLTLILIRLLL